MSFVEIYFIRPSSLSKMFLCTNTFTHDSMFIQHTCIISTSTGIHTQQLNGVVHLYVAHYFHECLQTGKHIAYVCVYKYKSKVAFLLINIISPFSSEINYYFYHVYLGLLRKFIYLSLPFLTTETHLENSSIRFGKTTQKKPKSNQTKKNPSNYCHYVIRLLY